MGVIGSRTQIAALASTAMLIIAAGPVAGIEQTAGKPSGHSEPRIDVVASGLDAPRGLTFAPNGVLYVAEAGSGGAGPCATGPEGDEVCLGQSGAVTAISRGQQWRVVDDLPSLADADQFAVIGPQDVAWSSRGLIVPVGLGADPAARVTFGDDGAALGTVVRISRKGSWRSIADIAAFEAAHDPDAGQPGVEHPDSNPYGVLVHGNKVIVSDAGGNSIVSHKLWPKKKSAKVSLVATLPFGSAEAPPFLGLPPGTQIPVQPVPTGMARRGGAYYVGELTGFPFPEGGASVYKVRRDRQPVVVASGFTNIIDVAFDRKGRLLVLEMFTEGLLNAEDDPSGALWRIDHKGRRTLIADGSDGLLAPGGLAVGRDGSYYVSNKAVFGEGQGEVLRIRR
ncbi:ScyD/ScyE family protein [Phytoactinopolyspora alkaliphila]|uniref:ScyD/ScyE family protein n=1 Tax=Phytoactinopolyspora alkaliphila TaxID=1783498 RepID=A0A6N9YPN0_9ACTN|nr:ScyD/ScyE family protein [Phytoactinopolyspora alkaliphila]NED96890.1 ScyD/ScyE family protein [Phytoactinopolyspora alkaliphila]